MSLSTFKCLTWIIRHTWLRSDAWSCTVYQRINNLVPICLHCALYKHYRKEKPGGHWECNAAGCSPNRKFSIEDNFWLRKFPAIRHISFRFASVETWKAGVNCVLASDWNTYCCLLLALLLNLYGQGVGSPLDTKSTSHDLHSSCVSNVLTTYHTILKSTKLFFSPNLLHQLYTLKEKAEMPIQ